MGKAKDSGLGAPLQTTQPPCGLLGKAGVSGLRLCRKLHSPLHQRLSEQLFLETFLFSAARRSRPRTAFRAKPKLVSPLSSDFHGARPSAQTLLAPLFLWEKRQAGASEAKPPCIAQQWFLGDFYKKVAKPKARTIFAQDTNPIHCCAQALFFAQRSACGFRQAFPGRKKRRARIFAYQKNAASATHHTHASSIAGSKGQSHAFGRA